MPIRSFRLPADAVTLAEVLPRAFQYPEHPEWSLDSDQLTGLLDTLKGLQRLWLLLSVLQIAYAPLRDMMRGFVWEEDGQPVGVINVLRQGASDTWLIGNVAVLPEYRRRGIARQLVVAAIDLARVRGAACVILDVVEGNVPAFALYESLGFTHYSGSAELEYPPGEGQSLPEILLADGYMLGPLNRFDWETRLALARRITPGAVKRFEPVDPRRFRVPRPLRTFLPLFDRLSGQQTLLFALRTQTGMTVAIGGCHIRTRPGGVNTLSVQADPAHPAPMTALLAALLREVLWASPGRRVELTVAAWQPALLAAAGALGFRQRCVYRRMGIRLRE